MKKSSVSFSETLHIYTRKFRLIRTAKVMLMHLYVVIVDARKDRVDRQHARMLTRMTKMYNEIQEDLKKTK